MKFERTLHRMKSKQFELRPNCYQMKNYYPSKVENVVLVKNTLGATET